VRSVCLLDRGISASAELQRLASRLRATYTVWLGFNPLAVARDRNSFMASETRGRCPDISLEVIDLPAAPTLYRWSVKPPDPDENIDGAHNAPGG
jgi:hypothetical protein